jgi:outer membrane protein assembly factor BamA
VLVARLHGEGVTGSVDEVPITELPYLGGGTFLRGYSYARFRDRIAAVGTLQYMWSIMPYASAFLFTDVGRVYRDWNDVTLSGLHMGFGVGLSVYFKDTFLADLTLGSSLDGGIAATAEFSPVLDARPRFR